MKQKSGSVIKNNYWSPYFVGILLGLVLLATFYIMGFGLGVSSGITRLTAYFTNIINPALAGRNTYLGEYLDLKDWIVFQILGMVIGGIAGSISAGRFGIRVEKGPRINILIRFLGAIMGGGLVGFASRLARGCESGVGLSGGATLSLGSWAFLIGMFIGGYFLAFFVRKLWR